MAVNIVSRAQAAAIFGVAKTTLDGWFRDGCPCDESRGRGIERRVDTVAVHRWLMARELATPDPKAPVDADGNLTLTEALRRKEVANAKTAEMKLAEQMATVAPVDTLKRIVGEELAATKARLREIPARFLPLVRAHAATPEKAKRAAAALTGLIEEALSEIKTSEPA